MIIVICMFFAGDKIAADYFKDEGYTLTESKQQA